MVFQQLGEGWRVEMIRGEAPLKVWPTPTGSHRQGGRVSTSLVRPT